jgi:hypothetical protein
MSTLYPNKYNNPTRIVVGTVNTTSDDMVLLCNTTSAAVIINLLDIPQNKWNAVWKLYVIDSSNNAVTNNITINAPSGFTINGSTSVVINVNGGICVVSIASNTAYLGSLNFSSAGGNPLIIESDGTVVTPTASLLNFSTDFNLVGVGNDVTISVADTGWVDLNGFDYYTGGMASLKPQVRRIGKQIIFRGAVYIPLVDPLNSPNVLNLSAATTYNSSDGIQTYSGISPAGCTIGNNGEITFNRGASVIPTSVLPSGTLLDNSYSTGWIFATRQVDVITVSSRAYGTSYTAPVNVSITNNKDLVVATLYDLEVSSTSPNGFIGSNPLRLLTSRGIVDLYFANYRNDDSRIYTSDMGIEFTVTAANANVGDTYSDAGLLLTVTQSMNGGTKLRGTLDNLPTTASGTLTRTSGTGSASIVYSSWSQDSQPFKFSTQQLGILDPSGNPYTYSLNTDGANEGNFGQQGFDGADPRFIGGFVFRLDGLTAFIS